jgi:hypothetical protein
MNIFRVSKKTQKKITKENDYEENDYQSLLIPFRMKSPARSRKKQFLNR